MSALLRPILKHSQRFVGVKRAQRDTLELTIGLIVTQKVLHRLIKANRDSKEAQLG